MGFQKIIGWLIFLAGVAIIVFSLYSSYNIFTGKAAAPEVFKIEKGEIQVPATQKGKTPTSPAELQKEMEKMISEQMKELLPSDIIPKILNMVVWSMFAGILILGGAQIANLGIKLIKN